MACPSLERRIITDLFHGIRNVQQKPIDSTFVELAAGNQSHNGHLFTTSVFKGQDDVVVDLFPYRIEDIYEILPST